jgi:hypothetical protein
MWFSLLRGFVLGVGLLGFVPASAGEAPAAEDQTPPAPKPYPTGIQCFYVPYPFGYGVIDDSHLTIDGSRRNKYLLTLFARCHELAYTLGIRLDRHGSELCTGDAIIAGRDRCVIRYVEEVANAREAAAIVEAREAAKEAERKKRKSDRTQ